MIKLLSYWSDVVMLCEKFIVVQVLLHSLMTVI
jgi:hypothetical protein